MIEYCTVGDTVYFHFAAINTSGSAADGSAPAAQVRLCGAAADAAPVLTPTPVLLSEGTYPAGLYEVAIDTTSLSSNSTYAVFSSLTVDGQNPAGFVGKIKTQAILTGLTVPTAVQVRQEIDANSTQLQQILTDIAAIVSGVWSNGTRTLTASLDPNAETIADAVLEELIADHSGVAGSLAALISDILGDTSELQTNQGNWLTATGFATPTNVTDARDAILLELGNLNDLDAAGVVAALTSYGAATAANVTTAQNNITNNIDATVPEASGVPAATANIKTMIAAMYQAMRNEVISNSNTGEIQVKNDAGTVQYKHSFNVIGGVYTRNKAVTP